MTIHRFVRSFWCYHIVPFRLTATSYPIGFLFLYIWTQHLVISSLDCTFRILNFNSCQCVLELTDSNHQLCVHLHLNRFDEMKNFCLNFFFSFILSKYLYFFYFCLAYNGNSIECACVSAPMCESNGYVGQNNIFKIQSTFQCFSRLCVCLHATKIAVRSSFWSNFFSHRFYIYNIFCVFFLSWKRRKIKSHFPSLKSFFKGNKLYSNEWMCAHVWNVYACACTISEMCLSSFRSIWKSLHSSVRFIPLVL